MESERDDLIREVYRLEAKKKELLAQLESAEATDMEALTTEVDQIDQMQAILELAIGAHEVLLKAECLMPRLLKK